MSFEDIEDLDVGVNALVNDLWKSLVALPVTTMKRVTVNPVRGMCEVFAEFFFLNSSITFFGLEYFGDMIIYSTASFA
jgi:hypothetical protein